MSTEVQATLERAREVRPVPDSNNLDVINVGGFPVVVARGTIAEGDFVAYFPPDLELPPFFSSAVGVSDYLRKGKIVRAVRLRRQESMGIALPLGTPGFGNLNKYLESNYWSSDQSGEGEPLDWYFGTKKFVPVLNEETKNKMGREVHSHPLLTKYTDIKRWERWRHCFNQDEHVVISEKIHGTNVRLACIGEELMVGSHNTQRSPVDTIPEALNNFYWFPIYEYAGIENMLRDLGKTYGQVVLFGETYGKGVQGGFTYGKEGYAFVAFDLMLNGVYVDYDRFIDLTNQYEIPIAPIDYSGPFKEEYVKLFVDAPSWFTKEHIREGIVIKPKQERGQGMLGRLILKAINPEYSIKKSSGKVEDNPIE